MDISQYMDIFLVEAKEHLLNLNQSLLELEENPQNTVVLDEIFRAAHTLKGMAATMGFEDITDLTHVMENVLSGLRDGEIMVNNQIVDILFKCLDTLQGMVEAIENGKKVDLPVAELIRELEQIVHSMDGLKAGEAEDCSEINEEKPQNLDSLDLNPYDYEVLKKAYSEGFNIFHLRISVAENTVMKSVRAFMVIRNLEEIGEIVKSVPPVQDLEEDKFSNFFEITLITSEKIEIVKDKASSVSETTLDSCIVIKPYNATEDHIASAQQEARIEEKEIIQPGQPKITDSENEKDNKETGDKAVVTKPSKSRQTVRVDIERLDKLMNLAGELVINKTRLEQISQTNKLTDLSVTVEQFDRISTDLQSLVMKVRMVPVDQVFNRFPRMVRDLAKDLGKPIKFEIEGKETELDRTVIDEIGDPLVHLLRNSIDHGIESVEERVAAGKSQEGHVRLVAKHEGNHVNIEVEDDGGGISVEKVRAKALRVGLISSENEQLDDNTIINMIFQPGFSTASQITEVSGRGVGLDAVRSKIATLSGTVSVETVFGKGTKFKIRLPLTLAIIQALLVNVSQEIYAIPLSAVDETMSIMPESIKLIQNQEVVLLRGKVLPLVRIHKLLGAPEENSETQVFHVVVVRHGDKQYGLMVDSLIGQQEIVIKSLGVLLNGLPGLAGAAVLGNGEISLILDIGTLL